MTIEEFNNTPWGFAMVGRYHADGLEYSISGVDFSEQLIAPDDRSDPEDSPSWVRCENVTITGGLPASSS